jgi:hypothetical protein
MVTQCLAYPARGAPLRDKPTIDYDAATAQSYATYREASPAVVMTVTDSEEDIRGRTMSQYFPERVDIELTRYPPIADIRLAMEEAGWTAVELTHTERTFPLTAPILEKYQQKACSALRLIPQPCFEAGMARLTREFNERGVMIRELYSYLWGRK